MRSFAPFSFAAALLTATTAAPATAQALYPDQGIIVNPAAAGGQTLLYPGGEYMRVVPLLREPGDTGRAVQLHMPHRTHAATPAPAVSSGIVSAPPVRTARAEPVKREPVKKAEPAQHPVQHAASEPSAAPAGAAPMLSMGAANLFTAMPTSIAPPPPAANAARLAKLVPAAAPQAEAAGLIKRSVILFAPGATDPAESALGAIKFLAGDLTAALGPSARIQLQAFGGKHGDKGSDARRLSLKRALSIRQVLINDGVPAERIDVSAMGGVDDTGPVDRVDVYIRA